MTPWWLRDHNFLIGNYGRGYLFSSDVANRVGHPGYRHAPELAGLLVTVAVMVAGAFLLK